MDDPQILSWLRACFMLLDRHESSSTRVHHTLPDVECVRVHVILPSESSGSVSSSDAERSKQHDSDTARLMSALGGDVMVTSGQSLAHSVQLARRGVDCAAATTDRPKLTLATPYSSHG